MDADESPLLGIGVVARLSGMPVRTVRFWADAGIVPATRRSPADHRLYDRAALARLELVATLRSLGLGHGDIRGVLEGSTTVAEVAAVHARALGWGPQLGHQVALDEVGVDIR